MFGFPDIFNIFIFQYLHDLIMKIFPNNFWYSSQLIQESAQLESNVICRPGLIYNLSERIIWKVCVCVPQYLPARALPGTIKIIRNKIIVRHLAQGFAMNSIDEFGPEFIDENMFEDAESLRPQSRNILNNTASQGGGAEPS